MANKARDTTKAPKTQASASAQTESTPPATQPAATQPAATQPAAPPEKAQSAPALAGYTVTFIHPGNLTLALPNARAACEAEGAETVDRKIPRHLVNMSRLLNVYGPTMAEAEAMVARLAPFFSLTPMQSSDSTDKAYYIFVD